jgi:hypothetical protein
METTADPASMHDKSTEICSTLPRSINYEKCRNILPLPVEYTRRSSTVSFYFPVSHIREEELQRRPSNGSFFSNFHSGSSRSSLVRTKEFNRTMQGMGIFMFIVLFLVFIVILYLCWDHLMKWADIRKNNVRKCLSGGGSQPCMAN